MAERKVYCVAYINRDRVHLIPKELKQFKYKGIEVIVPTVKILKKVFKGKPHYEEVPLLFNYGFVKVPYSLACQHEWLGQFRQDISAIFAWVKDPAAAASSSNPGEQGYFETSPRIGIATEQEVANLVAVAEINSIHSDEQVSELKPGQFIVLNGYPFDNMPAEVISINTKKQEVKVRLDVKSMMGEVTVSFENVFYSIYRGGFDEDGKEKSLDQIEQSGYGLLDRIMYKNQM